MSKLKITLLSLSILLASLTISASDTPSIESVYGESFYADVTAFAGNLGMVVQYMETMKAKGSPNELKIRLDECEAFIAYTKSELKKICDNTYNCFPHDYDITVSYLFHSGKKAAERVIIPLLSTHDAGNPNELEHYMQDKQNQIKYFLTKYNKFFQTPSTLNPKVTAMQALINAKTVSHPFSRLLTEMGI